MRTQQSEQKKKSTGRTYLHEGEWLSPKDVCKMLGITKGVFYHQMKLYDRDVTRIIERYKNAEHTLTGASKVD